MHQYWFQDSDRLLPLPASREQADLGMEKWQERISSLTEEDTTLLASTLSGSRQGIALLEALFGNSPFLGQCLISEITTSLAIFAQGPDVVFNSIMEDLGRFSASSPTQQEGMAFLRQCKRKAALAIAFADITGTWPLPRITNALTSLAEKTLDTATGILLREAAAKGKFVLKNPDHPQQDSGFIVLGMGKFGGRELNYSSDIDIIVLYDPDLIETDDPWELQNTFVRLTRNLVRMMDERTEDGYVFRTDLRLRPDPGATPLAMTVFAAETYYESIGQNWERAAMIKARPVAGDLYAGVRFLETLRPFVWRKHLDFAAIEDVHRIKRQINAHKGGATVTLGGHNVKLGRGGIREIEFYAQTQQLIWGGRNPDLRVLATCDALQALVQAERITQTTCDELSESYRFLRTLEHRLQMVNDAQTHSLPDSDEGLHHIAVFMGYQDRARFEAAVLDHFQRVESHYARLFEEDDLETAEECDGINGNLVFTGAEDDPETLITLEKMGFKNPDAVNSTIRAWHHSRVRATRSTRAREILTALHPMLLKAFADTVDPDGAFRHFGDFLGKLPAGVQLFSLFQANPQLLDLVAEVMGEAPRLAEHLARNPGLLDSVLVPGFFENIEDQADLSCSLETALEQARDYQDILDISRRWTNDHKFRISVQLLRGLIAESDAARALTDVADCVIKAIYQHVLTEFTRQHGTVCEGGMAVIAMGKAGSREMNAGSDLDLVFVYDFPEDCAGSDGEKSLAPGQYFARLSQRFINAMTAPTGEGTLFELDMRLRPNGDAGPIASSYAAYEKYYKEAAWTWEHMALTRARVVFGPDALVSRLKGFIFQTLTGKRHDDILLKDVANMRERIEKESHSENILEIKHFRGGVVDIEFIAQYIQLRYAYDDPGLLKATTSDVLRAAGHSSYLDAGACNDLIEAIDLWGTVRAVLRLTMEGKISKEDDIPPGLKENLARATGEPDYDTLHARMIDTANRAYGHYVKIIKNPARSIELKETDT